MAHGYSADLRNRVIAAVAGGSSARAAGVRFDVGVATAIRWVRRWRQTGSPMDPPRRLQGSILDPHRDWLLALRAGEPDLTLAEVAARLSADRGLDVSLDTVWRFWRREGISFKKNRVRH